MAGATQRSAAKRSKTGSRTAWLRQHRSSVKDTLVNVRANPSGTLLSILVIGVTLAFPLSLHVLQKNFETLLVQLGAQPQASLFLKDHVNLAQAQNLANELRLDRRLGAVRLIDKKDALTEFSQSSDLGAVIETLAVNPLPHTLVVSISATEFEGLAGRQLEAELAQTPGVATAQFDVSWIQRLHAISELASRTAMIFATLLGIGVVLVTGNTIRVGIHNRRDEIEVAKLCGATDAFVRRPFLYSGALQGIAGALIACGIVVSAVGLLSTSAEELARLYSSRAQLTNLSSISLFSVLIGGTVLGWVGAWISVSVYLRQIDPIRSE